MRRFAMVLLVLFAFVLVGCSANSRAVAGNVLAVTGPKALDAVKTRVDALIVANCPLPTNCPVTRRLAAAAIDKIAERVRLRIHGAAAAPGPEDELRKVLRDLKVPDAEVDSIIADIGRSADGGGGGQ